MAKDHNAAAPSKEPLMDTPETARYLNVPEQTLHHWAHRNVGPPYSKIGKYRRYRRTDVDAWLEAQKRGGAAA